MTERTGLVSTTTIETPIFTETHKATLVRQTSLYLQSNGIRIKKDTFDRGAQVILDALKRGLDASGEDITEAGKGIKKYIVSGLEIRSSLKKSAEKTLENASQEAGPSKEGLFATSAQLHNEVRKEIANFALQAEIPAVDQLTALTRSRSKQLQEMNDINLRLLPEALIENARQSLASDTEKAKLMRNTIVTAMFSDKISPIISMDELWNYYSKFKTNSEAYFTRGQTEQVAQKLNLTHDQTDYLCDMALQVKDIFSSKRINNQSKDKLHNSFNDYLLLLHPALEEEQINLDPEKQNETSASVWDDDVCEIIGGYKIPSKDVLIAAIRQATAAQNTGRIARLTDAHRAWNRYPIDQQKHKDDVIKVQNRLSAEDAKINEHLAQHPDLKKPRKRIFLALYAGRRELGEISKSYKLSKKLLRDSAAMKKQAAKMLEDAQASGKDQIKVSKRTFMRTLHRRNGSIDASLHNMERNIDETQNKLSRMVVELLPENITDDTLRAHKKFDTKEAAMLFSDEVGEVLERVTSAKSEHIFGDIEEMNTQDLQAFLHKQLQLLKNPSFRHMYKFGKISAWDLNALETLVAHKPTDPKVLNMSSLIVLKQVAGVADALIKHHEGFERMTIISNSTKHQLKFMEQNPHATVPESATHSLGWFQEYKKDKDISEIDVPSDTEVDETIQEFSKFYPALIRKVFPKVVNKQAFVSAATIEVPFLEEAITSSQEWLENEDNQGKNKLVRDSHKKILHTAEATLKQVNIFLRLQNSSFFNFKIAEGIPTTRYINLLTKKTDLYRYLARIPALQQQHEEKKREVARLEAEYAYSKMLNRKSEASIKLKDLKTETPQRKFIQKMSALGLAIEVA